jgi:hypothetical protein
MPARSVRMTFWRRWKREFSALWGACYVLLAPYLILWMPSVITTVALESEGAPDVPAN